MNLHGILKHVLCTCFLTIPATMFLSSQASADAGEALIDLAKSGTAKEVRTFLQRNRRIQAFDKNEALLQAAEYNPDPAVLEILLNNGADMSGAPCYDENKPVEELVDADMYCLSPIMGAVQNPNPQVLEFLLSRGASPHADDFESVSALHYAVGAQLVDNVALLLQYGANPNAEGLGGYMPLHAAVGGTSATPKQIRIINMLLDAGADPHRVGGREGTGSAGSAYEAAKNNKGLKGTPTLRRMRDMKTVK